MGVFTCSSSKSRRMTRFKCICSAVAVSSVVLMILLVDLLNMSGPFPHTLSLTSRFEALSNPRLILKELPNTLSTIQKSAGLKLLDHSNNINNEVDFTDLQFVETVEEQYNRIIPSQKWLRQRVSWEEQDLQKAPEIVDTSQELTVTIFSAPPAFTGSEGDLNRQALLSWLHLSPRPHVVLLGNHSSLHQMAEEFSGLVTVEPHIDYSFTGLPLFNSMVARANSADTNVTVLIQPNVMLLQDFMPGLRKLAGTFTDWALVAQRLEVADLPFKFTHKGGGIIFLVHSVTGESMIDREMASFVRTSGKLDLLEGVNLWAWNVAADGSSLFASPMPTFAYGAGYHDQWMARGLANGSRIVVDATDALVGFHVQGASAQVLGMADQTQAQTASWSLAGKEWQNIANLYLYRKRRDISAEEKDLLSGGWKLIGCPEPAMIRLCISETQSASNPCRCEHLASPSVPGTRYAETFLEKEARLRLEVIRVPALGTIPEYVFSMDQLLPKLADSKNNVVLVGVKPGYKDMLWSFICRAQALGVNNFLVAAFDKPTYKSALVRGIPVFYVPLPGPTSDSEAVIARSDVSTNCSQQLTQRKLQVVLQTLQKGFHVVWSDVDVIWFQNPLPRLTAFPKGAFLVASDEPNMKLPANGRGRVNPGFFYAQSEKATIKSFKDLMRYASEASEQPEQLVFGHVLCGKGAQYRVGVTECKTVSSGLRTNFLNRRTFANGLVNDYWWHENITEAALSSGVYVLHNNWINGAAEKVRRQKAKQVWFYNDADKMCLHPWQRLHQRLTDSSRSTLQVDGNI